MVRRTTRIKHQSGNKADNCPIARHFQPLDRELIDEYESNLAQNKKKSSFLHLSSQQQQDLKKKDVNGAARTSKRQISR